MDKTIWQNDLNFMTALGMVLDAEGGFIDDVDDPNGATNRGISLAFLQGLEAENEGDGDVNGDGVVDVEDVRGMSHDEAAEYYYKHFWYGVARDLPYPLSAAYFDATVNCGHYQAAKLLQRAVNENAAENVLHVDGIIGPQSMVAVKHAFAAGEAKALLFAFGLMRICFYAELAASPIRAKYLRGWVNRALTVSSVYTYINQK
ncbi:MAG: glycosyl hydrolase 108 family protein [Pseudomonadota bacterium]